MWLAIDVGWGTILAIKTIVVLGIIPLGAIILGYVFLLKMMAHMQSRLGPMDPGGFHGWFQLFGDGIKFIQKEDVMPAKSDRRIFAIAPLVVVASTFLVFVVLPTGPDLVVSNLDVGVFYALAVSSLAVVGVLMAGWASANKFALLGALRAAAQLIAYELPLLLAVVGVVVMAGTMSLQGIVKAQQTGSIFGWDGIGLPYVFPQIIGFALFLVAAQAELTQTPFDMPVAKTRRRSTQRSCSSPSSSAPTNVASRVSPGRKSHPRPVVWRSSTPSWPSGLIVMKPSRRASTPHPVHHRCRHALPRKPWKERTTGSGRSPGAAGASRM